MKFFFKFLFMIDLNTVFKNSLYFKLMSLAHESHFVILTIQKSSKQSMMVPVLSSNPKISFFFIWGWLKWLFPPTYTITLNRKAILAILIISCQWHKMDKIVIFIAMVFNSKHHVQPLSHDGVRIFGLWEFTQCLKILSQLLPPVLLEINCNCYNNAYRQKRRRRQTFFSLFSLNSED